MKKLLTEFKNFATRGNVVDLAVGVIIGGAFGTITTSLVKDIITPLISILTGRIEIGNIQAGPFMVGDFIQVVIDFLLTALVVFILVKAINLLRRRTEEPPKNQLSSQEKLLIEIRDILKERESKG